MRANSLDSFVQYYRETEIFVQNNFWSNWYIQYSTSHTGPPNIRSPPNSLIRLRNGSIALHSALVGNMCRTRKRTRRQGTCSNSTLLLNNFKTGTLETPSPHKTIGANGCAHLYWFHFSVLLADTKIGTKLDFAVIELCSSAFLTPETPPCYFRLPTWMGLLSGDWPSFSDGYTMEKGDGGNMSYSRRNSIFLLWSFFGDRNLFYHGSHWGLFKFPKVDEWTF